MVAAWRASFRLWWAQCCFNAKTKAAIKLLVLVTDRIMASVWKHIGLHGHSVGTFACNDNGIKWNSALFGKNSDDVISSTRSIPSETITGAQWSILGTSGHIRVKTSPDSKLHHEMRFDGFPPSDFETIRHLFKDKYSVDLNKLKMSAAGAQFGLSKMSGKKLTFSHCVLEDADEEGEVSWLLLSA